MVSIGQGAEGRSAVQVSATLLHQDQSHLLLVRLSRVDTQHAQAHGAESAMLLQLAQGAPDGLVEAYSTHIGTAPVIAVQWHPEWGTEQNADSQAFFRLLGQTLREQR